MRLFDQLDTNPMSIEELITSTKLYPAAVRAWCSAAQAYRLIVIKNGKLQMKKQVKRVLIDKTSSDYLGGQFSYLALRSLEYGAFEELFRSGKTRKPISTINAVQHATDWDHYAFLAAARHHTKLHQLLSTGCKLLDVGCGTGSMLAKINEEYPNPAARARAHRERAGAADGARHPGGDGPWRHLRPARRRLRPVLRRRRLGRAAL